MAAEPAPCALIVMGVSGSGKSTIGESLAKRLGWPYEDADKFHPASNVAKMSAGHPLTDEDRWPWLKAIAAEIDRVCAADARVVIGCSALKRVYREGKRLKLKPENPTMKPFYVDARHAQIQGRVICVIRQT